MKHKNILFLLISSSILSLHAQGLDTISFENIVPDSGMVLNGKSGETEYRKKLNADIGNLVMPIKWDTSFGGFWAGGWAISRKSDSSTVSSNFAKHLYCAKPGTGGQIGKKAFAVGQNGSYFTIRNFNNENIQMVFKITNTTYAYNSMYFGDAFAKKFGGSSGTDPDSFVCIIRSYYKGTFIDSELVYLADFRSQNPANDYILKDWHTVGFFGARDSFAFELLSSDNGGWGMNTPAFFALDDIVIYVGENVRNTSKTRTEVYPNPTSGALVVRSNQMLSGCVIYTSSGREIYRQKMSCSDGVLFLQHLTPGIYYLTVQSQYGSETRMIQILR